MGAWKAPDLPPPGGRGRTLSGLLRRARRRGAPDVGADVDSAGLPAGAPSTDAVPHDESQAWPPAVHPDSVLPAGAPRYVLTAFGVTLRVKRPSPFGAAILAAALAVLFVGVLTYYGARKFTRDAADLRASEEAISLAEQGAYTSTGDAFNGYLQILRYAEDPAVREITSTQEQRIAAMQHLLYLPTNTLSALAIVARDGTIFATSDPTITDVRESEAFNKTRGNLHPTNSDIVLPGESGPGYVEYTAPLKLPDGATWAILYARANPDVLWKATLRTSVDGSRNVILNSEGLFAAGVPDELLRQPWRGAPLENGGVRADIAGVDSICGLGPIGAQTQIDHGWHVASCLPISIIQTEADRAMGEQLLVTASGAVLAIVVVGGLLWFVFNGTPSPAAAEAAPDAAPEEEARDLVSRIARYRPAPEPSPEEAGGAEPDPDEETPAPVPPPVIVADVDALVLIEAYERRSARIARALRESVQARLMIASAQADEAFRLYDSDPESAAALHRASIEEMEALREGELRVLSQDMSPGLVRLGLPGALRALQKELRETIALGIDADPGCDGAVAGGGRIAIEPARRVAIFRAIRDTVTALAEAGAASCNLALTREGDWLHFVVDAPIEEEAAFAAEVIDADQVTFAAYGGRLSWSRTDDGVLIEGRLPAPGVEAEDDDSDDIGPAREDAPPEVVAPLETPEPVAASQAVVSFTPALLDDGESLAGALRQLAEAMPQIEIALDIADELEEPGILDPELAGALRTLVGAAARALVAGGAKACAVTIRRIHSDTFLSMMSDAGGDDVNATALAAARQVIEARGGQVSIGHFEGSMTITAEIAGEEQHDDVPRVVQLERAPLADTEQAGGDDQGAPLADVLDFGPGSDEVDDAGGPGEDAA